MRLPFDRDTRVIPSNIVLDGPCPLTERGDLGVEIPSSQLCRISPSYFVPCCTWCLYDCNDYVVQEQPSCCPRGPKLIQNVILCDAPCCPNLSEMSTNSMPNMGEFIWCQNSNVSLSVSLFLSLALSLCACVPDHIRVGEGKSRGVKVGGIVQF